MKKALLVFVFWFCISPSFGQSYPDTLRKSVLWTAIATESAFYLGGMSYLQFVWYKDSERVPFHFYNDRKGYLQIDKLGHAYGAYLESYIGYHWLRRAGVSKKKALLYGAPLGFILQAPIEIFDGMYENWGFSWWDIGANALGPLLLTANELWFDEQRIDFKFSFWPSDLSYRANGYLGDNYADKLFYDYNGHTYWLSFPVLKKYPVFNVSVGYSANGMLGEFSNRERYRGEVLPDVIRTRQFLLSLDLDWTKIPTESAFLRTLFKGLNFIKIPFPAVEVNNQGQIRLHSFYF